MNVTMKIHEANRKLETQLKIQTWLIAAIGVTEALIAIARMIPN